MIIFIITYLVITMKVKPSQEDIDKLYKKLKFKLFTLKIYDNSKYYIDNETSLIWDENKDIVGIYNNRCQLFDEDTKIINNIQMGFSAIFSLNHK